MAKKHSLLSPLIVVLSIVLVGLVAVAIFLRLTEPSATPTDPVVTDAPTDPPTDPPTEPPTDPPVVKTSTATIGAVGDLLMHDGVRKSAMTSQNNTFDFSYLFQYLSPYLSALDYAAANLETTLCGLDNGYPYKGYPNFNCPDSIVDGVKNAGFDMLLTANNHTYDTGHIGFIRTQQVIRDRGMDYIGTRLTTEEKNYIIKDLNGIRIGMICYTYNTGVNSEGQVTLNGGHLMTSADSPLINSFTPGNLNSFYAKLASELEEMKAAGAEATVVYIHWGAEYQLSPNNVQKKIAQKLCDLGVDVIIGGHAHVIQPIELLTATDDETRKTVCLYSTGNIVSNQRKTNILESGHTEDGVLFSVTFAKYSDGTVVVESANVLPTWVNMYTNSSGQRRYDILPLDTAVNWQTAYGISSATEKLCQESYDRTMALVGSGLETANAYFRTHQEQVEIAIGVKK